MTKLGENLLIYQVRVKQDPDAFGKIYDQYIEKIFRFVFFKISHKQEAEDITHEVFLKAWNYLIDINNKEVKSLAGLLYSIARNNIVDWYRERAQIQISEVPIETLATEPANKNNLTEKIATENESGRLIRVIKKMKQEYQEAILLKYVDELSMSEIAKITGKSAINVRVTLHRAVKKLREMVEREN